MKASIVLMILITLGYIIGQILTIVNSPLLYYLVQVNYLVLKYGFYWELLTSIIITPNMFDWLFNLVAFYFIYWLYRSEAGILEYIIFFLSGIVGNLFSLYFYSLYTASAGASGGIFGVFAFYAVIDYLKDREVNQAGIILLIATFILSDTIPFFNVDVWAHTGGVITGVLSALLLFKINQTRKVL